MIHAVYDLTHCTAPDPEPTDLLAAMRATAAQLGCTVLGELLVPFQPHGTTCVLVLAESHLTVSTWPEDHLAHIDLFTCRADTSPENAIIPIVSTLGSPSVHSQRIQRLGPATTSVVDRQTTPPSPCSVTVSPTATSPP